MKQVCLIFCMILAINYATAQRQDTIKITEQNVSLKFIKPSTNRYLVYFKMSENAPRTLVQFWTRTIDTGTINGNKALVVRQVWEDKDSIMHTTNSFVNASTFQTLSHESWWKGRGSSYYNLLNKKASIDGIELSDADTAKKRKMPWEAFKKSWDMYSLNWHLDLEVFSLLPYKLNTTFLIPYYDPGFSAPKDVAYTVIGTSEIKGYDNKPIDCWLLQHEDMGNKEVFYISKKTLEVLMLHQSFGGRYRYKVKLAFSE